MRRLLTILSLMLLLPLHALAQWSFDVPSIEAYIADHKDQRSLLLARSTLEQANTLLHGYSRDANVTYKEINVELDKYTRAFDVIDVMYQTLRTSLNTYDTYETFKQRIEDYKVMLTAFWDKCLSQGDIVSTDQLIITVNRSLLERLAEEGQGIYHRVHQPVAGQHTDAPEQGVFRDVEIHPGPDRLLEGPGLPSEDHPGDRRGRLRQMAGRRTPGLLKRK